jgi:hypothetical protein
MALIWVDMGRLGEVLSSRDSPLTRPNQRRHRGAFWFSALWRVLTREVPRGLRSLPEGEIVDIDRLFHPNMQNTLPRRRLVSRELGDVLAGRIDRRERIASSVPLPWLVSHLKTEC